MPRPSRYVRKLAKAYKITNSYNLDHQIQEFVNLLNLTYNDLYVDEEVWIDFIDHAVKDVFGLYRRNV